jgi:flavin-dependent dehydrogenase
MRQDLFFNKKKELGSPPSMELYKELLKGVPHILKLLEGGEAVADVKMASDWSYSAPSYAGPHFRIVGDAGCFIDPYFSSGVHLALTSGLSAALTIQGSRKSQISEYAAAKWHTTKVTEGYTRFLLVVMTILRQLRKQERSVLSDGTENGFEVAFGLIQPGMFFAIVPILA